jgi:ferric-dicitrate binding protein FerR (iron transport regulator)
VKPRVSLAEKTEIEINDARRVILREGSAWFHVPAGSEPLVVAAAGGEIVAAGGAVFGASFDGDRLTLDMASGGAEFIGPRLARSIRAGERIHHQPETNELLFDSNGVSMPRWARPLL